MFKLGDLKQTKVYLEALAEGEQKGEQKTKLQTISRMLRLGLNLEIIAQSLDLPLEVVQEEARKFQQD